MTTQAALRMLMVAALFVAAATFGAMPTNNPVANHYAEGGGAPAWTESFAWSRAVDMSRYAKGATDVEKFENARDELAAQGGGVLYYPAGTYDFTTMPADGPSGRGLMLRRGVVIRGEAPSSTADATTGKLELPTKFVFGFRKMGMDAARGFGTDEFNEGLELAQAFINFPLDVKPASPDAVMPRVWEAKTRGFYSFRNNWNDGPNSIVAQIYARDGQNCGWSQNEAGCFQIYGLGHHWARRLNDAVGKTGSRWHDNVVMLPEDPVNPSGRGRVTLYDADPKTGSGTVTFDMSRAYQCFREVGEGKDKKPELYDAGIVGTCAFAADYSGKCGAPVLVAIADRITGGGKKVWGMQLPPVGQG